MLTLHRLIDEVLKAVERQLFIENNDDDVVKAKKEV
jgi:hypothetical protein